ncbi:hypothetical protein C5167_004698 [Papaver somniferum]|uniref:Uncharacterized protein n=1 Tax=Papaver somniferum TaxID=3469 RepID=A0A4Y7JCL7_PAPSO|nr:hypothetical protein C5167_004698 [Papaver somniferum]
MGLTYMGLASRKLLKEELPKIFVEEINEQNDEAEPKVIDKDDGLIVEEAKFGSTEHTALYARIIRVLDMGMRPTGNP